MQRNLSTGVYGEVDCGSFFSNWIHSKYDAFCSQYVSRPLCHTQSIPSRLTFDQFVNVCVCGCKCKFYHYLYQYYRLLFNDSFKTKQTSIDELSEHWIHLNVSVIWNNGGNGFSARFTSGKSSPAGNLTWKCNKFLALFIFMLISFDVFSTSNNNIDVFVDSN